MQSFILVAVLVIAFFAVKAWLKKKNRPNKAQPEERPAEAPQQTAAQPADSKPLSAEDDLGKMIFLTFRKTNPDMEQELLDTLRIAVERDHSWQAQFVIWLMHYVGKGGEPDAVDNAHVNVYLKNSLFQKAYDMAPQHIQKYFRVMRVYMGSGINCTPIHEQDTAEKIRMRGLFHAVNETDFDNGAALLFGNITDEAKFWNLFFSTYPGVDDRDPDKMLMKTYFRGFFQPEYADQLQQECADALERAARGEQPMPGDDLRLLFVGKGAGNSAVKSNRPCQALTAGKSDAEKRFPVAASALLGNAACMYHCCTYMQYFAPAMTELFRVRYGKDLAWGRDQVKALLEAVKEKGDPNAGHYLEELEKISAD